MPSILPSCPRLNDGAPFASPVCGTDSLPFFGSAMTGSLLLPEGTVKPNRGGCVEKALSPARHERAQLSQASGLESRHGRLPFARDHPAERLHPEQRVRQL